MGIRESLRNTSATQRNAGLLVVVLLCLIVYLIPTPGERIDAEAAPPTPYTVRKSYLRTGGGWVLDNARVVRERIPSPFRSDAQGRPLSNSKPHEKQEFPDFQSRMYKLTAEDWPEYEAKLVEFSQRAFPKPLAKWAVRQVRLRSPLRRHSGEVAKAVLPPQVWQTGKDIPTTRNSFQDQNPHASYNFFDDTLLENWSRLHFGGSLVKRIWDGMERVVLKADFWRYLVVFLEGGYYSGE